MVKKFKALLRDIAAKSPSATRKKVKLDVESILNSGIDSLESLLTALENRQTSISIQLTVCWILGQLNDKRALGVLLKALESQDSYLSWEAAKSIATLGGNEAVQHLIQILSEGKDPHNRAASAYVLGILGDKQALDSLIYALSNSDIPEVRSHAAEALGHMADSRAIHTLILSLKDNSAEVRFWSTFALGEIGNSVAIPELKKLAATDKACLPDLGLVSKEAENAIERIQKRRL
jgi:HEAT repeat protein